MPKAAKHKYITRHSSQDWGDATTQSGDGAASQVSQALQLPSPLERLPQYGPTYLHYAASRSSNSRGSARDPENDAPNDNSTRAPKARRTAAAMDAAGAATRAASNPKPRRQPSAMAMTVASEAASQGWVSEPHPVLPVPSAGAAGSAPPPRTSAAPTNTTLPSTSAAAPSIAAPSASPPLISASLPTTASFLPTAEEQVVLTQESPVYGEGDDGVPALNEGEGADTHAAHDDGALPVAPPSAHAAPPPPPPPRPLRRILKEHMVDPLVANLKQWAEGQIPLVISDLIKAVVRAVVPYITLEGNEELKLRGKNPAALGSARQPLTQQGVAYAAAIRLTHEVKQHDGPDARFVATWLEGSHDRLVAFATCAQDSFKTRGLCKKTLTEAGEAAFKLLGSALARVALGDSTNLCFSVDAQKKVEIEQPSSLLGCLLGEPPHDADALTALLQGAVTAAGGKKTVVTLDGTNIELSPPTTFAEGLGALLVLALCLIGTATDSTTHASKVYGKQSGAAHKAGLAQLGAAARALLRDPEDPSTADAFIELDELIEMHLLRSTPLAWVVSGGLLHAFREKHPPKGATAETEEIKTGDNSAIGLRTSIFEHMVVVQPAVSRWLKEVKMTAPHARIFARGKVVTGAAAAAAGAAAAGAGAAAAAQAPPLPSLSQQLARLDDEY